MRRTLRVSARTLDQAPANLPAPARMLSTRNGERMMAASAAELRRIWPPPSSMEPSTATAPGSCCTSAAGWGGGCACARPFGSYVWVATYAAGLGRMCAAAACAATGKTGARARRPVAQTAGVTLRGHPHRSPACTGNKNACIIQMRLFITPLADCPSRCQSMIRKQGVSKLFASLLHGVCN